MTKQCTKCGQVKQCSQEKKLSEFHISKAHRLGFSAWCKACVKICTKTYYRGVDKKEHQRANKNNNLKRQFGITIDEYARKVEIQENNCAICEQPEIAIDYRSKKTKNLAVDHCHKTGKVRDLLCSRCNQVFGLINENTEILTNMVKYAKKHNIT